MTLSLAGKTVLVTRPAQPTSGLVELLQQLGANVVSHPVIEILPPESWAEADRAIHELAAFDWIVFASPNGVRFFGERLRQLLPRPSQRPAAPQECSQSSDPIGPANDPRTRDQNFDFALRLARFRFAAIGRGTAQALQTIGIEVDLLPENSDSEGLATAIVNQLKGQRLLVIRGNRGSPELGHRLTVSGFEFREVVAYRSLDCSQPDAAVVNQLKCGNIDWVTVTSMAIAESTVQIFGENLRQARLVSISPKTTARLTALGFPPHAEANPFDRWGIAAAIESYRG